MLRRGLHGLGYVLAHLLFLRARTPAAAVARLRLAYRLVGVSIETTERDDGTERTIFRCPYRDLGANRFGPMWVCHDILDRVDDGYVTYLRRHRDLEYRRPASCGEAAPCSDPSRCYSEVRRP